MLKFEHIKNALDGDLPLPKNYPPKPKIKPPKKKQKVKRVLRVNKDVYKTMMRYKNGKISFEDAFFDLMNDLFNKLEELGDENEG